ncbi:FAD-dependent monooxygenase [Novosphingobium sp. BL-8H]|uniref:NAD(P)/FAD-dependent oxidoreductase n=1 Tax=Novosphingobium sp. BL-8H TaxID=3127640 RepID=UPI0037580B92
MAPHPPSALVIGGGLAGSAAACLLSRAGHSVHLIEKESGPHHKVCGEFLSIEAAAHLQELGVDPLALGGVPIERIRLVRAGSARVAEAALPFGALGLSRHVLDEALIARAQAAGARVERGLRVSRLEGTRAVTSLGEATGEMVLLATGKLPIREGTTPPPRPPDAFVGFKMHYRLAPTAMRRLRGVILLALLSGGYAGLQMVEDGRANLCLVIRQSRLADLGGNWEGLREWLCEAPEMAALLHDAEPLFARPVSIGNLAYGTLAGQPMDERVLRLGDRWAMTASLTGDGMAIALRSAFVAARCVDAGRGASAYHAELTRHAGGQIRRAMAMQNLLAAPGIGALACRIAAAFPAGLRLAARATRLPEWQAEYLAEYQVGRHPELAEPGYDTQRR